MLDNTKLIFPGTGYAVAEGSIKSDARVTISSSFSSRVKSSIDTLKKSYPPAKVSGYGCNLSKPTVEQDIKILFKQIGEVDHIVYTAGDKLAFMSIQDITLESIQCAGHVRYFAPLLVAKVGSKYLNPGLRRRLCLRLEL
jgi:NADP-dependent 3-hydroxy acid dehydrogenase YdfG